MTNTGQEFFAKILQSGKSIRKERFFFIVLPVVLIVIAAFLFWPHSKSPVIQDVTVTSSLDHNTQHIKFPYSKPGVAQEKLDFTISLAFRKGQPAVFKVIPDDCVESIAVNDTPVALKEGQMKQRCNSKDGFRIDLKPYLKDGANEIHIHVLNLEGNIGLKFHPAKLPKKAK